jgi:hypothetical protein
VARIPSLSTLLDDDDDDDDDVSSYEVMFSGFGQL